MAKGVKGQKLPAKSKRVGQSGRKTMSPGRSVPQSTTPKK